MVTHINTEAFVRTWGHEPELGTYITWAFAMFDAYEGVLNLTSIPAPDFPKVVAEVGQHVLVVLGSYRMASRYALAYANEAGAASVALIAE